MQMDLWYRLALGEFSDVTERASELLDEADANGDAEETTEAERPVPVPVDFF